MILKTIKLIPILTLFFLCQTSCGKKGNLGTITPGPVIDSFFPVSGMEGSVVTITGSNFSNDLTKNTVMLGNTVVPQTTVSSNQLIVTIPKGIALGDHCFSVQVGGTTAVSLQTFSLMVKMDISDPEVMNYNYSMGTQTIGPSYGFTSEDRLVESAKAILEMGSNILKISLATSSYNIADRPKYSNLTALIRDDPSFSKVLDMPFSYYFFWARSHANWADGYSASERTDDSTQISDMTRYLLTKYNNSGKQFFVGHWEGDWYLLTNYDPTYIPSDTRINGMIQWYRCRQNAVDEAIRITPHSNVEVFTYCEVNRVVDAMSGLKRVVNKVLPFTNVDYVSYSSYDAQNLGQVNYNNVLNYLESYLPNRPLIKGKRVFIGEMGRAAYDLNSSKSQHESVNRENIRKALSWGVPFVLYWEMFNNEVPNGIQRGFWLIDNKNEKWPLYLTYQNYYTKAKYWVASQKKTLNRLPTRDEFLSWAYDALGKSL